MTSDPVDAILRDIEERAKREYLPIIGREAGDLLERLLEEKRPCVAVEIGVLTGYATLRIARRVPEGCMLYGFEISDEMARTAEANLALAGLSTRAIIVRGDARQHVDQVRGPVNFVLIDADRSHYLAYLKKLEPKFIAGTTVVAAIGGSTRRLGPYLDHVRMGGGYDSEHHLFDGTGFEVSVFKGQ